MHFWVMRKGQECQFTEKKINGTLKDMTDKTFEQVRATEPARCEDRSLDDPDDKTVEDVSDRGKDEK